MNRKELQTIMWIMVLLIVMLFSSVGYIWFSEVRYPLFGKHADSYREISQLSEELQSVRALNDSLKKELRAPGKYLLAAELPDSLIHPQSEIIQIGTVRFASLGAFHTLKDAQHFLAKLQPLILFRYKIFKQSDGIWVEVASE